MTRKIKRAIIALGVSSAICAGFQPFRRPALEFDPGLSGPTMPMVTARHIGTPERTAGYGDSFAAGPAIRLE